MPRHLLDVIELLGRLLEGAVHRLPVSSDVSKYYDYDYYYYDEYYYTCAPASISSSEILPLPSQSNWRKIERMRCSVGWRPG